LEIKDAIAALNRTTSLLAQNLSTVQSTMTNDSKKLDGLISAVQEVRQTQEAYIAVVESLRLEVQGLQKAVAEQTRTTAPTEECPRDDLDEPLSPLSEGGISLTEYLNVKRMRLDRSTDAVVVMTGRATFLPSRTNVMSAGFSGITVM
jgi:hypothetical protein